MPGRAATSTDGGAGIGSGPGMSVGAALALRDTGSGRLPVAVLGDGDFLMGVTALWTAVRNEIPLLIVVANNRSFFNDELHQERVARQRGRPVENRWIGQAIRGPDIDLATMARGQGCTGIGPVEDPKQLVAAIREASPRCAPAKSVSSMCTSLPATPPRPPRRSCSAPPGNLVRPLPPPACCRYLALSRLPEPRRGQGSIGRFAC